MTTKTPHVLNVMRKIYELSPDVSDVSLSTPDENPYSVIRLEMVDGSRRMFRIEDEDWEKLDNRVHIIEALRQGEEDDD